MVAPELKTYYSATAEMSPVALTIFPACNSLHLYIASLALNCYIMKKDCIQGSVLKHHFHKLSIIFCAAIMHYFNMCIKFCEFLLL